MAKNYEWFTEQVKNEMANCRYCMEAQPMTRDLAKDCFEVAQTMKNNYEAIKAESGKEDTRLESMLEDWCNYSKKIYQNVNALIVLWDAIDIPTAKAQEG